MTTEIKNKSKNRRKCPVCGKEMYKRGSYWRCPEADDNLKKVRTWS